MSRKINPKYARDTAYSAPPRWGKLYARYFPEFTCPASRYVKLIAEDILRDPASPVRQMLIDAGYEPDHWASSLESTVQSLWEKRAELAREAPEFHRRQRAARYRAVGLEPPDYSA